MQTKLGRLSNVKALRRIFDPQGLHLVDIGCGAGDLARKLAYVGATVIGIEPDTIQAQKNALAEPVKNVVFYAARANNMPLADQSVDGVIFSLSLHHVPHDEMQSSLDEARRIVKPAGFLAVVEPLREGSYEHAIELFHDETEVRQNAIKALQQHAQPHFKNWHQYFYETESRFSHFDEFTEVYTTMTYNTFDATVVCSDAVRARFESARDGDGYTLLSPMRIDFYWNS